MSSDPGNMPFQRLMSEGEGSTDEAPAARLAPALHAESILMQEFNYANVTAYQAREERARIFNTFLVMMGVIISALVTLETIYTMHHLVDLTVTGIVAGMFCLAESALYFGRLFALGTTVQDSVIAMNMIKEFYLHELKRQMPRLEQAFRWRLASTRRTERSGKMPLMMSISLSFVGSASGAYAVYLFLFLRTELALPAGSFVPITPTDVILIVLTYIVIQVAFAAYYAVLDLRYNPARTLRAEAEKLGLVVSGAKGAP